VALVRGGSARGATGEAAAARAGEAEVATKLSGSAGCSTLPARVGPAWQVAARGRRRHTEEAPPPGAGWAGGGGRGASEQAVTEACRAEGPGAGPELAGGTCRTHWRSVVRQEFACARLLRQRTGKQTFVNCLLLLITGSCTKRVLAIPRRIYYAAMCVIARTKYHAS
jgi:hypothetical protein